MSFFAGGGQPNVTPVPTPTQTPGEIAIGDVNEDNAIDTIDTLLAAQYYVGIITQIPV